MRLIAERLAANRGGEAIFGDVGFDLAAGESLVITGPNGAGKSTLLRVLAGLLPASAGSVRLDGGGPEATKESSSHYLAHDNAMKSALTVLENLQFWRRFLGPSGLEVGDALEAVGLGGLGHLPYAYLSTGQRRRTAIARLLVSYRPVWLLDEPTSGLDAASEDGFARLMTAHLSGGGILVAATHVALGLEGAKELRMGRFDA